MVVPCALTTYKLNPMNALAKAIAQDRMRLGMSQQELAAQLGVSQQSVSKWEEGTAVPRSARLRQLAQTMGNESHTTLTVNRMLAGQANPEGHMFAANKPDQEKALDSLVQAAQDIARAAQAIATSAAHLAQSLRDPPDTSKH